MKPVINLDTFIGNSRAIEILKRAMEQDRLPHAMIFAGPEGVGKCTLALLLAQSLNCLAPAKNIACGRCSACQRILAVIESRHLECRSSEGQSPCGTCTSCRLQAKRHPDVWLVEPEKTTITIDQVRRLVNEIAFQPFEARYRVVIFDPADLMRVEAHNSLLKTLEEPPSRTVIVLVTTNPYALLETIRSRCRLLLFGPIPEDRIARHLIEVWQRPPEEARMAAALSGGSMSAALAFNVKEYRELRELALRFISLLLRRGKFGEASSLAAQVAKERTVFQRWVETALMLLQDVYYAGFATERVGQRDLVEQMTQLAGAVSRSELVEAIKALETLRAELRFNVNRQIALEAMFISLAHRVSR